MKPYHEMRNGVCVLVALSVLTLAAGCGRSDQTTTTLPTHSLRPTDSSEPIATPDAGIVDSTPVCPPARGGGTISPAISIYSITFLVNGHEQVVRDDHTLRALPGDEVQVTEVTICTGSFSGDGGEACVDFAPADQSGQEIVSEHKGTHLVPVTPGFMSISTPGYTWIIRENWRYISAVLNHWTPKYTGDLGCAGGRCEHDDRIIVEFR